MDPQRSASWDKFQRQTDIHRFTQLRAADAVTGVCLWGPPGSGKSYGMAHIKELLKDETVLAFNVDDYSRFVASEYMFDVYSKYVTAKQQPIPDPALLEEERILRSRVGFSTYAQLVALIREAQDTKPPPRTVYEFINVYLVMHHQLKVDTDQWDQFVRDVRIDPDAIDTWAVIRMLGPWIAKRIGRNFVYEMTGRNWHAGFHEVTYGDVNSILYVPFVHDMEALVQRVIGRKEQFGNMKSDDVRNIFKVAYGDSLLKAMDSGIYAQIVVQGNSSVNYVMMSMERVGGGSDGTPPHYILVKEYANDIQEAMYIDALLHAIMLPESMRHSMSLVYDLNTRRWLVTTLQPQLPA